MSGPNILVATQGYFFETVESLKLSHEAIKYLAVNDADWILDERKIRKIAGGIGMLRKSLREALSFVATFPLEIQVMHGRCLGFTVCISCKVGLRMKQLNHLLVYVCCNTCMNVNFLIPLPAKINLLVVVPIP
jgi:superfamily II DNA/RNA helicase